MSLGARLLAEQRGQRGRSVRLRVVTKPAQRNWLVGYRLKRLIVDGCDKTSLQASSAANKPTTHKEYLITWVANTADTVDVADVAGVPPLSPVQPTTPLLRSE